MIHRAPCKASSLLATFMIVSSCVAADRPIVVPMQFLGNFPAINVKIDGYEVLLIVDLGNSGTVALQQPVIDRVQVMPTGDTSKGIDPKGNVIVYPKFRIPRVQIGTAVFTDVIGELDAHDPSYQADQVGQQGFLGTSLLKKYKVVLDYPHRRITLVPRDAARRQSAVCKGAVVPFSPSWHGEPVTEADIDIGHLTVWWDTGAPMSGVSKKFVEAAPSQPPGDTMTTKRLTLGGSDFGPLGLGVLDVSLPPGFDGFIGYNFFSRHVVCIDFPGNRLLIQH